MEGLFDSHAVNLDTLLMNYFFKVPLFQRSYVWDPERVETLLKDIKENYDRADQPEYFIGGMVFSAEEDTWLLVIDGQQRLATVLLTLASAVYRFDRVSETALAQHYVKRIRDSFSDPKTGQLTWRFKLDLQDKHNRVFMDLLRGQQVAVWWPKLSRQFLARV